MDSAPRPENVETVSKQEVVTSLTENPEDLSIFHRYLDQREKEVKHSKDTLNLNVEVAEIYRDSGLKEAAAEAFQQAAEQAWQEGEGELYERLLAEVQKLTA